MEVRTRNVNVPESIGGRQNRIRNAMRGDEVLSRDI